MQDRKIPIQPTPIQQLSAQVANQIAAGEVVERPASVVKELVENSLDAGAGRIEVEIERGGSKYIRVRDDGCGIRQQDLELALCRHATSKLTSAEELGRISSLGFRGEALASIGSVARLELISRPAEAGSAWSIRCHESHLSETTPASHPPGTSVVVADLFHNVPARRRFLRAERTEFLHIEQLLRGLALSRFDVDISLTHNRRSVFRVSAAHDAKAREQRVLRLCGRTFVRQSLLLDYAVGGVRLYGWLGRPTFSRSQRDLQFLFVNGRLVRDRLIGHALRQAYGERLPAGRQPGYVLQVEIDPALVDVNVHPTKHEVRFRDSRLVHDFLAHCIDDALHTPVSGSASADAAPISGTGTAVRAPAPVVEQVAEDAGACEHRQPATTGGMPMHTALPQVDRGSRPQQSAARQPDIQFVQLHARYLLVVQADTAELVDLPAARAWLAAEELGAMLTNGEVVAQPLLIPARVELAETPLDLLEERSAAVEKLGFDLSRSAVRTVLVRRIPVLLGEVEPAVLIAALAQVLAAMPADTMPTAEHAGALVAACRFANTTQMSRAELESIWRALQNRRQNGTVPNGVMTTLGAAQLAALLQN